MNEWSSDIGNYSSFSFKRDWSENIQIDKNLGGCHYEIT